MTKNKKFATLAAMALIIGATSVTAFAASAYSTPAEAAAGVTGQSVDGVITQHVETGKTYGTLADEAGVLEDFEDQMLANKKAILEERVAAGTMTQERADAIIAAMEENMEDCDGTCTGGIGAAMGAGFGTGSQGARGGMGSGFGGTGGTGRGGFGSGLRDGSGLGNGNGLGDGTCVLS